MGPVGSAVAAGFAVILFGTVYLTPAGEAYLEQWDQASEQNKHTREE